MNELEISFESSPWEAYLLTKKRGDLVSAANLLALLEDEDPSAVEQALLDMEEAGLQLDVSDLPKTGGAGEAAARLGLEIKLAKSGLDPKQLPENDPLRLYLEELAATPAAGDESQLARRAAAGDETARARLTNLGLSRVLELAREHVGYGVLLLDLIQEGSLGLWQGICRYQGGDYGAFRDAVIRFYMAKAVALQARANGIGGKLRRALEDYRRVDQRLLEELGRNPTLEEIAQGMHMTREEADSIRKMLEDARLMAQAKSVPEPEEEAREEEQAVEDTAAFRMRQRILDLLSALSKEEAQLLTLRFGLEGEPPLSPEETGPRLGLTAEEVLNKEAAALAKLRGR